MSRPALRSKTNIIVAVMVLLAAVSGGAFLLSRSADTPQSANTAQSTNPETETQREEKSDATVTDDYVSYKGQGGMTALSLLKSHADVRTKTYEFGELVTSINGQDGGGTKYWTFYINGAEAQVGAGAYITKDTDTIEWKLR